MCRYEVLVEGRDLTAVMGTLGVVGSHTTTNHVMEVEKVGCCQNQFCMPRHDILLCSWLPSDSRTSAQTPKLSGPVIDKMSSCAAGFFSYSQTSDQPDAAGSNAIWF